MTELLPTIGWLREYRKPWLRLDIVAGLMAAPVVVPKAMAFATIADLPVEIGLYAAPTKKEDEPSADGAAMAPGQDNTGPNAGPK